MANEFEKHGVPYELMLVKGGNHGFYNLKPEDLTEVSDQVAEWLMPRLTNLDPDSTPVQ